MPRLQKTIAPDPGPNGIFLVESQSDISTVSPKEVEVPVTEKQSTRAWILSIGCLATYVALTAGAAQLASLAFQTKELDFSAPFLFVLCKALFRTLAFPLYIIVNTIVKLAAGRKLDYGRTWRRCLRVCGDEGITWRVVLFKFFPPMLSNVLVQVAYTIALQYLATSLASALVPPSVAISYLLSWFFLKHPVLLVKVGFVFVCFGGVAVIVQDQLRAKYDTWVFVGIMCMLGQNFCLAAYQLTFKKAFPKGDLGQVSFAVSGVHVLMVLFYLPVPVILYLVGYETYDLAKLPYPFLTGSWMASSVSSLAYGYGLVVSNGFFMSLSELAILASNSGTDSIFRGVKISDAQIIGTVVVGFAFLILVAPDHYLSINIRKRVTLWRDRRKTQPSSGIPKPESQVTLELADSLDESPPTSENGLPDAAELSLDGSAIGEEDVMENIDLHVSGDETQLPF